MMLFLLIAHAERYDYIRQQNISVESFYVFSSVKLQPSAMLCAIVLSVIVGILGLYYFCFRNLNRFKKHGIPHKKPLPLLGNLGSLIFYRETAYGLINMLYNIDHDAKYVGMYDMTNPVILLRDPELIKLVTLKHFDTFMDHLQFIDESQDMLFGRNLLSLRGEKWRQVRTVLSPSFTASKMKGMFKLMLEYSVSFSNYLAQMPPEKRTMEMKNLFNKYTNDIIATCAFGISVDSMTSPDNDFYVYGTEATNFDLIMFIKFIMFRGVPWLVRILRLKFVRDEVSNFFRYLVRTTIQTREEKGIVRPDMLQLMMESKNDEGKPNLTIDEMVAQAFIFFFGGFETSSTLISFAAHEIAVNSDVHEALQKEIDGVLEKTNGQATYEAINNMEYLDAVLHETLRMYPPLQSTDRLCLKDFELPPALPGTEPFTIRKGEGIWIPIYGLQHDPKYFENPEKFDPERFLGERKRESLNCGAYLPFGLGPRMCIGSRFALLKAKALFFNLLAHCDLKPNEKTRVPVKFVKGNFNIKTEGGLWLDIIPRKKLHHTITIPNA